MPRFVILTHDHPFLHWDLMLEDDGALQTWRLLAEPEHDRSIRAEMLCDHRIAYLDYEGPVSGNRGVVKRWDHGTFERIDSPVGQLVTRLIGERIQATLTIKGDGESLVARFEQHHENV